MAKYLDSVLRVLPAVQAKQLTDMLNKLKVEGEIRNADEYQLKLKEFASLINDKEPKASFRVVRALVWYLATAEAHNMMTTSLKNDIEALFLQVEEIGVKTDDHHFLMMKNLFADMERGLDDQENNIRRLEWLAGENNEFSIALVNSFKSAGLNKVPRSDTKAKTLYFDNRTYKNKTASELPSAVVSENGKKLILGTSNDPSMLPISARLFSDSSSYGTQIQPEVNNPISNLIDGTRGTFWTRNVYLPSQVEKVTTVIQFDIGLSKDVDYAIVEGAVEVPFYINQVDGVAHDGSIIPLRSDKIEVIGSTRIDFIKTFVKAIKITFSVESYTRAEYFVDKKSSVHQVLQPRDKFNTLERVNDLGPLTTEVLASKNLANILNVPQGTNQQINSYLYPFALDNVWFGNSLYNDSGIFVSKPLKGDNLGVVAVRANENLGDDINSIEYEIIKRDISPKYNEIKFPIPYLEQTSVANERLILTKREGKHTIKDAGTLRFCPYVSPDYKFTDSDPVIVYENGIPLKKSDSYLFAIGLDNAEFDWRYNFTHAAEFSNYTLDVPKMWIKILKPKANALYTVSYTIRTSDSYAEDKTVWLDKEKTAFLSNGGRVRFNRDNPDVTIESEIYLQITLRRNSASRSTSPELDEYAILGATYNG